MKCFDDATNFDHLDRHAFKFQHKLMGHPALTLNNLSNALPALSKQDVFFSEGLFKNGDDFEGKLCGEMSQRNRPIEEIIENIRVSDSYVMVNGPEKHPSFKELYAELVDDISHVVRKHNRGHRAIDPRLYLFIASPNSVTPFHIDRYASFLMQFRGSKEVTISPQWDERIVSPKHREDYVAYGKTKLPWRKEHDAISTSFTFKPGETLHTPFTAGHHVRNGSDDISISLSIFFNTRENLAWRQALLFNHRVRPLMHRVGMAPVPVGRQAWRDTSKSHLLGAVQRVRRILR